MGIVIAKEKFLLYVLPIISYKEEYKNAYHKTSNIGGNKKMFLMKKEEFPFLDHDSILKTNDLQCISTLQIIGGFENRKFQIDTASIFFQEIHKCIFNTIFNNESYTLDKMNNKFTELLDNELIKNKVTIFTGEHFNINSCLKGVYGRLSNIDELYIDTSKEGSYSYQLEFTDDFDNHVNKEFFIEVIRPNNFKKINEQKELQIVV